MPRQELPTTAYALLGLLTFGDDLTGYELKQRADSTLRFYWVSPAMSQVYTELARLADHGLVRARDAAPAKHGRSSKYRITAKGRRVLETWLVETPAEFPTLKHPVALRLLIGHLTSQDATADLLRGYLDRLAEQTEELHRVRESLRGRDGPGEAFRFPSLVADWGLEYYQSEREITEKLLVRLAEEDQ